MKPHIVITSLGTILVYRDRPPKRAVRYADGAGRDIGMAWSSYLNRKADCEHMAFWDLDRERVKLREQK